MGLAMLCVLGLLATSAPATAYRGVLAVPEYGRCKAVTSPGGAFKSGACTELGGLKNHEWFAAFGSAEPLVKPHFGVELTAGSKVTLEVVPGTKITCTGATGSGEYTSNTTTGAIALTLTGCEMSANSCENTGTAGEVRFHELASALGVLKQEALGTPAKIGVRLEPQVAGEDVADFTCGPFLIKVIGKVITKAGANAMQLIPPRVYMQTKGEQHWEHFEGGAFDEVVLSVSIAGSAFVEAGLEGNLKLRNEEAVDIHCQPEGC
jgi:hypothetical protein